MKKKTKKKQFVSSHIRHTADGKPVKVRGFRRKKRPKSRKVKKSTRTNISYGSGSSQKTYDVQYYRDANGQIVGRRDFTRVR